MSETPVSPLEQEIAVEQRHVDRVYAQLGRDREAVTRLEKGGYGLAGAGVPGSLV
ncbi:MAG: hypothetical protein HOV83_41250, partial [Catenulispora sp.]|nr:hypothetical protein [Catenulispora sp.]